MFALRSLVLLGLALLTQGEANAQQWQPVPGKLTDLSFGANGSLWGLAPITHNDGGAIYRRDGNKWTRVPGWAIYIAVDPDGLPWIINRKNQIFRFDGSRFIRVPGAARNIAIGADGSVWIVGTHRDDDKTGSRVFKRNGDTWQRMPGSANFIAVDGSGNAWTVDRRPGVFRFNGTSFEKVESIKFNESGFARGIAITPDAKTAWLIGPDVRVYRWDGIKATRTTAKASSVAVDPAGVAWVATNMGAVSKWTGKPASPVDPAKRWHCEVTWRFSYSDRSFDGYGPNQASAMAKAREECRRQSLGAEAGICARSYVDADCFDQFP